MGSSAIDTDNPKATASGTGFDLRPIGFGALATVLYFSIARLSLSLALGNDNATAVWPTSGLAIGGLVVFGRRYWPVIAAGAFALTWSIEPHSILLATAVCIGNTLEAVVGVFVINRFADGSNCLRSAPSVFRFIVFGAILAPLPSAGIGVPSLVALGIVPKEHFFEVLFTWYTGNLAGVLIFAPLVILYSIPRRRWSREQIVEGCILLAVLVLVGQTICGIFLTGWLENWPSAYLVIPVLLWAAFRLGRRGTVAALIVLTAIAVTGTMRGFEVFKGENLSLSLIYLQIFLSVVSMISLVVAGLVSQLRLAKESLEQQVETRTQRLEEMIREKDDLMAIAAHDLQAPLAGMRNLLQIVQTHPETLSSDASERVFHEMENATDGMFSLVSSLLIAKRAEELGMSLTIAPCDAVEVIRRMISMHSPIATKKGITIQLASPEEMYLSTHPESISQIASNLLSNAVKYSPEGARIDVTLWIDPDSGRFKLVVRDEGPGISPRDVETIFDKFRRADNQPTNGETSHGIGLYIVKKLATALGGEVRYTDGAIGGSCFTVTLPSHG